MRTEIHAPHLLMKPALQVFSELLAAGAKFTNEDWLTINHDGSICMGIAGAAMYDLLDAKERVGKLTPDHFSLRGSRPSLYFLDTMQVLCLSGKYRAFSQVYKLSRPFENICESVQWQAIDNTNTTEFIKRWVHLIEKFSKP